MACHSAEMQQLPHLEINLSAHNVQRFACLHLEVVQELGHRGQQDGAAHADGVGQLTLLVLQGMHLIRMACIYQSSADQQWAESAAPSLGSSTQLLGSDPLSLSANLSLTAAFIICLPCALCADAWETACQLLTPVAEKKQLQ